MKKKSINYKFIDLFAGLGGFHLALERCGCKCVFSSELKEDLRKLYHINFPNTLIEGDITKISPEDVPHHDILCAGFPCQPFSQAGNREGFNDKQGRGNLFDYIIDIISYHKPKYVLLENVSNLKGHDEGKTWRTIQDKLTEQNYSVKAEILSPHEFGIPQHRRRIYIVAMRKEFGTLEAFDFPKPNKKSICDITTIIDETDTEVIPLRYETVHQLDVWQEFIDNTIANGDSIPSFPVWAMEFGATYDFIETAPAFQTLEQLRTKKGKLGKPITGNSLSQCIDELPIYAQSNKANVFPDWKIRYIQQNRDFYSRHKSWIDEWLKKVDNFENSHLKFEWNCGKEATPQIIDKIVQFRASGIRIKMPTFIPALNLVGTQIPIFPWINLPDTLKEKEHSVSKGRYMTLREAAKVQGMQNLKFRNDDYQLSPTRCYEALGNAVNVELVEKIANKLLEYGK